MLESAMICLILCYCVYIYLGVNVNFNICHFMIGCLMGRGNQYIQLVNILYCELPTIGKQLLTFAHRVQGLNWRPQRWEVSVLPLYHRGSIDSIHINLLIVFNTAWDTHYHFTCFFGHEGIK